jgi:hypothetical protein
MPRPSLVLDLKQIHSNAPVAQVAHLMYSLKWLSGCSTEPYWILYIVRNDEAGGSNPLPSTILFNNLDCFSKLHELPKLPI